MDATSNKMRNLISHRRFVIYIAAVLLDFFIQEAWSASAITTHKHATKQEEFWQIHDSISWAEAYIRVGFQDSQDVPAEYQQRFYSALERLDGAIRNGGVYQLSPAVQEALAKWRQERDEMKRFLALPWHEGPTQIAIFPELSELMLPAGYQILLPADVAMGMLPKGTVSAKAPTALLLNQAQGWIITISLVPTGHIAEHPLSSALLPILKLRSNPLSNPAAGISTSPLEFLAEKVRWIKKPTFKMSIHRGDWIYTTGKTDPRKVGVPEEFVARWILLGAKSALVAEYKGYGIQHAEAIVAAFHPIWEELSFQQGSLYENGTPASDSDQPRYNLDDLVTGPKSRLEKSLEEADRKREEKQRSELIWFLCFLGFSVFAVLSPSKYMRRL